MDFPSHRNWIGVISAMIIWALWFLVVYGLTGVGCDAGWQRHDVLGGNLLSLLMLLCTLVALTSIGWCARRGLQAWRLAEQAVAGAHETNQRQRFMGLVMLLLSLLAALGTVMMALPIVMLAPCATA